MKRIIFLFCAFILCLSLCACAKYSEEDLEAAKAEAYEQGQQAGYETGNKEGYEAGNTDGYATGYAQGYEDRGNDIWGTEDGQAIKYSYYTDVIDKAEEKGYLTADEADWMRQMSVTNEPGSDNAENPVEYDWVNSPDYADETEFESALNAGEDVTGKTVTFTVREVHTDSSLGFNYWAGQHLNFCSEVDHGLEADQTVTVKILDVRDVLGSWVLYYFLP